MGARQATAGPFFLPPCRHSWPLAAKPMKAAVSPEQLRVAMFSGNYNYVKDGANQALNRLVGRIEQRGGTVRVYSPVSKTPAFEPTGTLVAVPSVPIPGRDEYRFALGLPTSTARDIERFRPGIVHLAAPDWLGHSAKRWAKRHEVPVVASVHTRFETYFDYYRLGFVRRSVEGILKSFYGDLAEIYAPSESMADVLRADGYSTRVGIWSRGVDRHVFRPEARDMEWRRSHGISDNVPVIGFVGRLVLEKGLDIVAAVADELTARGIAHRMLIVGEGPAREWIEERLPGAVYTGFLGGHDLARAYASFDMFLNPSITETFGNVTLEAMACRVPVVAAIATGSSSLVADGVSGRLLPPGDIAGFADALAAYATDEGLRTRAGAQGFARALAYDWDAINDTVIDRYCALQAPG